MPNDTHADTSNGPTHDGSGPTAALDWTTWRTRWPNAGASRFVDAARIRWHVQVAGTGPALLLLHGSGGATHSWCDVLPRLAERFTVVAPDLPGHGFTTRPPADARLALAPIAADLGALLDALGIAPRLAAGHSAGAAIALQIALDRAASASPIVGVLGLNAALAPPPPAYAALAAPLFAPLARSSFVARALGAVASFGGVADSLLDSAGTPLPAEQRALYAALAAAPRHVHGVLTMMANWELAPLLRAFPQLDVPVALASAPDDPWVPPATTRAAAAGLRRLTVSDLAAPGHLAHEVDADAIIRLVGELAAATGVLSQSAA